MNIAIMIPSLRTGGAERAVSELGRHLADQGNHVYYFVFANSGRTFFDISGKIVKTHIPYLLNQKDWMSNVCELGFAARRLRKIKQQYKIDVSISFMEWSNVINVCSRTFREKVIVSVRTVLSKRKECAGVFIFDKKLLKNLYRLSDRVVAVSDGVAHDLIDYYEINKKKIVVIPNVSSRREVSEKDYESSKWEYGGKTVVCVGRLDSVKQFDSVIRSFKYVVNGDPDAKLVIVGDGKQMNHLIEVKKKLEIETEVLLVGFRKDIGFYLDNASCFVMASKVEGFPNAMVEAMAYGVPIISTDSPGGCGEILGKKHDVEDVEYCEYGIMVPYINRENIEDDVICNEERLLGKAILEILNNDELRSKYSEQSFIRSKNYSYESVMEKWDKLLEKKTVY